MTRAIPRRQMLGLTCGLLASSLSATPAAAQLGWDKACPPAYPGKTFVYYLPDFFQDSRDVIRSQELLESATRDPIRSLGYRSLNPPSRDEAYEYRTGTNTVDTSQLDALAAALVEEFEPELRAAGYTDELGTLPGWDAYYLYKLAIRDELDFISPSPTDGLPTLFLRSNPWVGAFLTAISASDALKTSARNRFITRYMNTLEDRIGTINPGDVRFPETAMKLAADNDDRVIVVGHGHGHVNATAAIESFREERPKDALHAGALGTGSFSTRPGGAAMRHVSTVNDRVLAELRDDGRDVLSQNVTNYFVPNKLEDLSEHDFAKSYIADGLASHANIVNSMKSVVLDLEYDVGGDYAIEVEILDPEYDENVDPPYASSKYTLWAFDHENNTVYRSFDPSIDEGLGRNDPRLSRYRLTCTEAVNGTFNFGIAYGGPGVVENVHIKTGDGEIYGPIEFILTSLERSGTAYKGQRCGFKSVTIDTDENGLATYEIGEPTYGLTNSCNLPEPEDAD